MYDQKLQFFGQTDSAFVYSVNEPWDNRTVIQTLSWSQWIIWVLLHIVWPNSSECGFTCLWAKRRSVLLTYSVTFKDTRSSHIISSAATSNVWAKRCDNDNKSALVTPSLPQNCHFLWRSTLLINFCFSVFKLMDWWDLETTFATIHNYFHPFLHSKFILYF